MSSLEPMSSFNEGYNDNMNKPKWRRICGPKVRTGCITCKVRRIKCDEQKPECYKCISSNRKCDGYIPPEVLMQIKKRRPRRLARLRSKVAETSAHKSNSINILSPIYVDIIGDPDERRSFHHFRVRTADDLSGFFHSNFWQRLILQLGHSEPAIKHALIAVGAAHETYQEKGVLGTKDNALALLQYNKSIAHLSQRLSAPSRRSVEVALICCILFVCYESLRGDYQSALTHLHCGTDILNRKYLGETPAGQREVPYLDPQTDEAELIGHFTRLDVSACAFTESRVKRPEFPWMNSPDLSPGPFRSVTDARRSAEILLDLSLCLVISHSPQQGQPAVDSDLMARHNLLLAACDKWSLELDELLKSPYMPNISMKDLQGVFTLVMHMKATRVIIRSSLRQGHDRFLPFEGEFKSILSIASWLVNPTASMPPLAEYPSSSTAPTSTSISTSVSTSSTSPPSPTSAPFPTSPPLHTSTPGAPICPNLPRFTNEMGIIAPLYYVSMNSTDAAMRRTAVALLSIPRREGIWDSLTIAKIAHCTLQVEQQGGIDATDRRAFQGGVPAWEELLMTLPAACQGWAGGLSGATR